MPLHLSGADTSSVEIVLKPPDSNGRAETIADASPAPTRTASAVDTTAYETEQALVRAREKTEQKQRIAELCAGEEERKKRELAQAAARRSRKRLRNPDEEDNPSFLERWRKPLIGIAAVIVLAMTGHFAWGWYRTHRKIDPPLLAEVIWEEFSNDPEAANQKYANSVSLLSASW